MSTYVALLRGINVGGRNSLPMQDLRNVMGGLDCKDVRTYIQSGNVVFRFAGTADGLSERVADVIETRFGFRPFILIQPAKTFAAVVAAQPFAADGVDPKFLHVWFTSESALDADVLRMQNLKTRSEEFKLIDSAFYLFAPDGVRRSKLASNVEKCLGVAATARNWRTVGKITELLDDARLDDG